MSRSPNNSLLIESACALAEAATGSLGAGPVRIHTAGVRRITPGRGRRWTPAEDAFLRANLGRVSMVEMGRALGRSKDAVHNRWERDLHLPSPRKNPEWLTLEQLAAGLGVDGHSIAALADRGILTARRLPMVISKIRGAIRVVDRKYALAWIADPMHWMYFHPERVGCFRIRAKRHVARPDVVFWRQARAAVDSARKTWGDEWLRIGDAADRLGLKPGKWNEGSKRLNKAIHQGILKGVYYGNWWILRSEADRFGRERLVRNWGKRKITWVRFNEKPRMIYLRKLTKTERAAFEKKRLRAPFYADMRQRNVEIRRRIRRGETPAALAKRGHLTVARIKQIEEGK